MTDPSPDTTVTITVPSVSGEAAAAATDLLDELVTRYQIKAADADALFEACVSVYVRGRMVQGDRPPTVCSLATGCSGDPSDPRS